jgi:hypothetical protein
MATSVKMAVFWFVAPCSPVEICLIALMMDTASTSETSVNFYESTRRCNPEDSHFMRLNFQEL